MGEHKTSELERVVAMASNLSPEDKVRLVEQVMVTLEHDLSEIGKKPRRSLYGLWPDVSLTESHIDDIRTELWNDFPREDI